MTLPLDSLVPLKQIKPSVKVLHKYQQVLASVREVGIIEPLIVFPQDGRPGTYLLLDGHVRLDILKELGDRSARCLIATDDEAYTYNKMINHIATVQEHFMILRAIKAGVPEDRIAKVLNVNIKNIRQRRNLLDGICPEAVELLRNKHVSLKAFAIMKKMKSQRQLELAELLIAANNYTVVYARALLAATRAELLVDTAKPKTVNGISLEHMARMEREMEALQRDLKGIEASHGNDVLNLVLAGGYLEKLFVNSKVMRYLTQHHKDIFDQLEKVLESASMDSSAGL
jgi:RepB plasmid partitioning protein/ParB-like nuclease domain